MKLVSVDCNHCGAPLEVGETTRFVTCGYCSKRLAVQRTDSAIYTEVLDEIRQTTNQLADDMEVIKMQNQIEQLDREWAMEREGYMVRNKHGVKEPPVTGIGAVIAVLITLVAIVFMGQLFMEVAGGSSMEALVILGMAGFGILTVATAVRKGQRFQQGKQRYQTHRQRMLRDLEQLRRQ